MCAEMMTLQLAALQSRWIFTNPDESYLTKVAPCDVHGSRSPSAGVTVMLEKCPRVKPAYAAVCPTYVHHAAVSAMQAQQLSLNYHFNCEQRVCFATGTYFGFNGALCCHSQLPLLTLSAHQASDVCCCNLLSHAMEAASHRTDN